MVDAAGSGSPERRERRWTLRAGATGRTLVAELQAAREALAFYADEGNWELRIVESGGWAVSAVERDRGERARAVLKEDGDG